MEFVSVWSGLHPDLLEQIATRLPLWEDLTAFRGVCTTWRAAVTGNKYKFKVPLLMLSDNSQESNFFHLRMKEDYGSDRRVHGKRLVYKCKIHSLLRRDKKLSRREKKERSYDREFYSLSKREICARLPFPDATGTKCMDVGFGWILTVSAKGDTTDGRVSLVKPYYPSPKIQLPNLKKIPDYEGGDRRYPEYLFVTRAMLLADPSETSDFILVLISDISAVIWRNGDKKWRVLNPDMLSGGLESMIYYQGMIYATNGGGSLIWDPANGVDQARLFLHDAYSELFINSRTYLVESTNGEILVIVRKHHPCPDDYLEDAGADFRVMRADLKNGTIELVKSVGKDAIFLGENNATAVAAADYPGVLRPNCIYFTDDRTEAYFSYKKGGGKDMGIYNVGDGSTERFLVESFSYVCPPVWVFPTF